MQGEHHTHTTQNSQLAHSQSIGLQYNPVVSAALSWSHLLPQLLCIFQVKLVQCLNVVRGEGDGDQQQVAMAPLHQPTYNLVRLRTQPG